MATDGFLDYTGLTNLVDQIKAKFTPKTDFNSHKNDTVAHVDQDTKDMITADHNTIDAHVNGAQTSVIHVSQDDRDNWDGKSDFSGNYNDLTNKPTIPEAYTLPNASASTLGGVKVGNMLSMDNGAIGVEDFFVEKSDTQLFLNVSKGDSKEKLIQFTNPDDSTYHHDARLYGGNATSNVAIGCWDMKNNNVIWRYIDTTKKIQLYCQDKINYLGDMVVEYGTSGDWTYRKWASGFCELWGTVATGTLTNTASGNVYYSNAVTFSVPTFLKSAIGVQFTTTNAGVLSCARYGTLSNNQLGFRVHRSTNNTSSLNINVAIQGTWG